MNLPRTPGRAGFTLTELLMVVVILGILAAMATPRFYRTVNRSKVNEAAGVVAADLEQAVTLATRRRQPMQLSLDGTATYTIRDRATAPADTVRVRRDLTRAGDQGVESITFSRSPVQLFPNGMTDGALTVTLTGAGQTRTVTLSAAGQVRVR